jgi:hypothetical protein
MAVIAVNFATWHLIRHCEERSDAAINGFAMFPCAMTGMGGPLILGYQKSVTAHANHSADSWVLHQRFKTDDWSLEP